MGLVLAPTGKMPGRGPAGCPAQDEAAHGMHKPRQPLRIEQVCEAGRVAMTCAYRPRPGSKPCGEPARGKVRDLGPGFGALRRQVVCDRPAALLDGGPGRDVSHDWTGTPGDVG